ncbi:tudor domain-containing protein 10 isoform X3 [Anolis carolinensis]|uniref:tudor domain-containing protein 10 isoform X3 n=1 Tax=Anolis carolinensis TaxID=28377 RepID=UPI002F2B780A
MEYLLGPVPLLRTRNSAMEVFFGNLPQKNLSGRFKSVGVKKGLILHKRPALPKPAPPKASQPPNGSQQGKPPIGPEAKDRQDDLRDPIDCSEMPDLELVAHPGPPSAEGGPPAGPPAQALLQPPVQYAVPFEMRSLFLIQMLKACFREAGWLLSAPKVSGRAALMVTESFPQTPFFWAIRLTKGLDPGAGGRPGRGLLCGLWPFGHPAADLSAEAGGGHVVVRRPPGPALHAPRPGLPAARHEETDRGRDGGRSFGEGAPHLEVRPPRRSPERFRRSLDETCSGDG